MKKKAAVIMLSMALAASSGVTAFAAGSGSPSTGVTISKSDKDSSSSSSRTTSTRSTNSVNGVTKGANDATGFVNSTGKVSSDGRSITIGESKFHMVDGAEASIAGLTENTVATINAINSGNDLNQAGTGLDLSGYKALTRTTAMMLFDQTTGAEKKTASEIPLYVPNLVGDLGTVQVLFYNNFTGKWQIITPIVDLAKKEVKISLPCSGTFSVIYKK